MIRNCFWHSYYQIKLEEESKNTQSLEEKNNVTVLFPQEDSIDTDNMKVAISSK